MIIACKCGKCGHIEMSSDSNVTFEFDFLEKRVIYICPECKHNNVIEFDPRGKERKNMPLPGIRLM